MSVPPKLANDCFALPPGVDWTPVDEALDALRSRLGPVKGVETLTVLSSLGRVLAKDVNANRSHPPYANAAVDGYGFAHEALNGDTHHLPLADGKAAAGAPFNGTLRAGHALRILTGAAVPEGVDTIVLQEDTTLEEGHITFAAGLKRGANVRPAGEDMHEGQKLLSTGHKLTSGDIGMLASAGVAQITVYERLRVGVLSTGSELVTLGQKAEPYQIFDANRPMLLSLVETFGFEPVDLGKVQDDRAAVLAALDEAAKNCDAILTSGGASAGDEDHISAALDGAGALHTWRIAIKPGRPLALGIWHGVPIFGLPGNPVAAFVCTLVFGAPALGVMAGRAWNVPSGVPVLAAFDKRKKGGRSEYLRARLNADGEAEIFASEGSGRVSGLSWADGLIALGPEARDIAPGDLVRYISFNEFTQ